MRIAIWGLGHAGAVSAACFAQLGHEIIGIEPDPVRRATIAGGHSPVEEPGLEALISDAVQSGHLKVVEDGASVVPDCEVSLLCVGTPGQSDGSFSLEALLRAAERLGAGLRDAHGYHGVVLRSTVGPGAVCKTLIPCLEQSSGRTAERDFGVAVVPEFMREGSALQDFREPPFTVIGELDARSGDLPTSLFEDVNAPLFRVGIEEAVMLKLVCNAFHGLKAAFANEVGRLCEPLSVDSGRVMELTCADTRLNISPAYLQPGFAFGGSCLPKDLRALVYAAQCHEIALPVLDAVLPSNSLHLEEARRTLIRLARRYDTQMIGMLGLSFKSGTADLRDSPAIELLRALQADGFTLHVYDPHVLPSSTAIYNAERSLPGLTTMLCASPEAVLNNCPVVVLTQDHPTLISALQRHAARCSASPKELGVGGETLALLDVARCRSLPCAASIHYERWCGPVLSENAA